MKTRFLQNRMKRLFTEGFTVLDIAEALVSFDADRSAAEVKQFMADNDLEIVGLRKDGLVSGYVRQEELLTGKCVDYLRSFTDA
ncbi:MAG: bifunctional (p)ppGpp synthetase/guanosine-3',5'-bis(diphosphate) 3'-pyrophosphohydrolase, partial [Deltaproteobacteria bacterium]|nr:bifunctional (p)ppGpp synthetase/guanosine-3',5'-bis(diphosphate) 3'-pyrophosphohydrolase [Deltaproteobacteria bacterium]